MKHDPTQYCEHCGQKLSYKSSIGRGTAELLIQAAKAIRDKGINTISFKKELLDEGKITVNQYGNRTHLVRLGLVIDAAEVGNYHLTRRGLAFLNGQPVPKEVTVYKSTKNKHSNTVENSEELITLKQAMGKAYWEVPGFEIKEGRVVSPQEINQQ